MSENQTEQPKIKTSNNPAIQGLVEEQIKKIVKNQNSVAKLLLPTFGKKILNRIARSKVADQLKLNKRATETKKAKDLSETDELTGLYDENSFDKQLEMKIAYAKRHNKSFYVILFDFNRLKLVNDSYGHSVGNSLLKTAASIPTRKEDPIYRFHGDEFGAIIEIENEGGLIPICSRYMNSIKDLSGNLLKDAKPLPGLGESELPRETSISIGISKFKPGMTVAEMKTTADIGLYRSKQTGRDRAILANKLNDNDYSYQEVLVSRNSPVQI